MRTTLDIEDQLLAKARRKAAEGKKTLTGIVEEALRRYLMSTPSPARAIGPRWVVVTGARQPDVDIADRDRLYEAMETRRR